MIGKKDLKEVKKSSMWLSLGRMFQVARSANTKSCREIKCLRKNKEASVAELKRGDKEVRAEGLPWPSSG